MNVNERDLKVEKKFFTFDSITYLEERSRSSTCTIEETLKRDCSTFNLKTATKRAAFRLFFSIEKGRRRRGITKIFIRPTHTNNKVLPKFHKQSSAGSPVYDLRDAIKTVRFFVQPRTFASRRCTRSGTHEASFHIRGTRTCGYQMTVQSCW